MKLEIIKLLFDFGLLVLIWLIQLVVYPSFSYYRKNDLVLWHKKYTLRISYVVIPLMMTQLSISVVQAVQKPATLNILNLILVVVVWISTFLQFVPLHHKISSNSIDSNILQKLVSRNWFRTALWTLIFILSCVQTN